MPEEKFRLPQSSYEELTKIIKAYGHMNGPSVPSEVGVVAGVHETIVSRNNAFLVAIGVVEGGKKKNMTPKGKALADAMEHEIADEIERHWRTIVMGSDFLQKLISAVKVRKGMDRSTLQSHIAYSAGEPKRPAIMTGASAVVDILNAAGLLHGDGDKLVAPSDAMSMVDSAQPALSETPTTAQTKIPAPPVSSIGTGFPVTIQIQVQCSAAEVDGLAPKLKALLKELGDIGAGAKGIG